MLSIKRKNNEVIVLSNGETASMSLADTPSMYKTVDTLLEYCIKLSHENESLNQMRIDDAESFATKSIQPLFRDVSSHLNALTRKSVEDALALTPQYLQGESLKSQIKSIAQVYKDAAESVLSSNGDTLSVGKSLYAKANAIQRDLDLLESQLSAPLQKLKSIKMEKAMHKAVFAKGIAQGKLVAENSVFGVDSEAFETAAAINKAKLVLGDPKAKKDAAIKKAKTVARGL